MLAQSWSLTVIMSSSIGLLTFIIHPIVLSETIRLYLNAPIPIVELCEKSTDWAFEQEIRVPRALSDCQRVHNPRNPNYPIYVTEIPPECIERVILGERFNEDEAFEIYRLAERADVMVSRSYVNHWDYNLGLFGTSYRKGGKIINSPSLRNPRDFPNL